jgi:hypothetical protein
VLALRCVRDADLAGVRRDSTLRACPSIVWPAACFLR